MTSYILNFAENGEIKGSIQGVPASTAADKVWSISQALGDIAFAFPFSLIFLEIMVSHSYLYTTKKKKKKYNS